jgi:hypothetical protein
MQVNFLYAFTLRQQPPTPVGNWPGNGGSGGEERRSDTRVGNGTHVLQSVVSRILQCDGSLQYLGFKRAIPNVYCLFQWLHER